MNAEVLLKYFDRMSDAPDAMPRLRHFILDLAVRGGLVEQDPNDEPAHMLVARLISRGGPCNGQRRKSKTLPAINDIPFALPSGWAWERIGNIGETNIGLTYSPQDVSDVGIPVLRSSNIQNGKLDFDDLVRVQTEPKPSVMVQDGDLLICARNGSRALVGKVALIENLKEPAAFGAFMAIFRSEMNKYLYHFVCSPLFRQMISEVNTTTINQITQNNLRSTLVPIPPLAEQHRIVAKVEELKKLCDRLEEAQKEREARRDRLTAASLHQLGNSADGDELRAPVEFFINHLPRLSARPDQIQLIRQAILDLAVRGGLVEQDPNDEPAHMLVARLISRGGPCNGQRRKSKTLPAINDIPFALPSGWAWERIGNIGETNIGLTYSPQDVSDVGIPVLRSSNIQNGKLDFDDLVRVQTEPKPSVMVQDGDLLICARNGSRALVGKVALIENLKEPAAFGAFMAIFRSEMNKYLYHFVCSPLFRQMISEVNTTTINQITQNNLRSTLVPIPPLAEQHRIVAKVEELKKLCDRLEESLITTRSERRNLLDAVLYEAIASSIDA